MHSKAEFSTYLDPLFNERRSVPGVVIKKLRIAQAFRSVSPLEA